MPVLTGTYTRKLVPNTYIRVRTVSLYITGYASGILVYTTVIQSMIMYPTVCKKRIGPNQPINPIIPLRTHNIPAYIPTLTSLIANIRDVFTFCDTCEKSIVFKIILVKLMAAHPLCTLHSMFYIQQYIHKHESGTRKQQKQTNKNPRTSVQQYIYTLSMVWTAGPAEGGA